MLTVTGLKSTDKELQTNEKSEAQTNSPDKTIRNKDNCITNNRVGSLNL